MKKPLSCFLLLVSLLTGCASAEVTSALVQRADKIVAPLGIADSAKATRVRDIIARQYHALAEVHGARDERVATAKAVPGATREGIEAVTAAARTEAKMRQAGLHAEFLAALSRELSAEQIEAVKDGMTYGVAPRTYAVYLKMMPDLTDEQKAQIHAWLYEAREHALTAGSSDEKHAWFGKYKGRINNYLSKAGYNLKDAEKNLKL